MNITGNCAGRPKPHMAESYRLTTRLVIPSAGVSVCGYNWMASPEDEDGFMEYARAVLESYFPQHGMDYDETGYVSRVYGAQDFARLMNIAIILAAFFLYAFVFLLGLIGVLNVINTVSFQIKLRAKELAVLQSVGMPSESVRKMLNIESILCAGKGKHAKKAEHNRNNQDFQAVKAALES